MNAGSIIDGNPERTGSILNRAAAERYGGGAEERKGGRSTPEGGPTPCRLTARPPARCSGAEFRGCRGLRAPCVNLSLPLQHAHTHTLFWGRRISCPRKYHPGSYPGQIQSCSEGLWGCGEGGGRGWGQGGWDPRRPTAPGLLGSGLRRGLATSLIPR